jgi:hypothetical protein
MGHIWQPLIVEKNGYQQWLPAIATMAHHPSKN